LKLNWDEIQQDKLYTITFHGRFLRTFLNNLIDFKGQVYRMRLRELPNTGTYELLLTPVATTTGTYDGAVHIQ
jgi:hypothetical protein